MTTQPKPTSIPMQLLWSANNSEKVYLFLGELEKPEHYKLFFGKKDKNEASLPYNTSGVSKTGAFKTLAQAVWPEYYAINPTILGARMKNKFDSLTSKYKEKAQLLRQTGGGIDPAEQSTQGTENDSPNSYYIPAAGPQDDTPQEAKNLWDKIIQEFEFFPRLHNLMCARPNVIPICLSTGVGPKGKETVFIQPRNPDLAGNGTSPEKLSSDAPASSPSKPGRAPKESTFLGVNPIGGKREKRRFEELLTSSLDAARLQQSLAQARTQDIEERKLLFEQYKEGLITKEEHNELVAEINHAAKQRAGDPLSHDKAQKSKSSKRSKVTEKEDDKEEDLDDEDEEFLEDWPASD
ncbi:hypothetical protein BOTBODRAFT_646914 [Botryobasidium botryosum FD-172 SS1]|uniref:Myb/SANT-like domain-containing protein n=1 Tax=Botryobasidium botryosum (strain FD-172 SS1) TaxID=930990 RepID=A0A067MQ98_BOTB1|nr:hypothetical protein BOTBODRAFT_646914 [Botryobasidium botryosum FD-172 SS1]